jgi:phosphoribosyl 1,2-cyclic phosphodiesterase
MDIRILGAHNVESRGTRCISLLVDGVLAIDAGALTSSLDFPAQKRLRAVLLTHQHYDHVRDIPVLGMNMMFLESSVEIGTTRVVYDALTAHLVNDQLYPNLFQKPPERPALRFRLMEPGRAEIIGGYSVLPVPVNHSVDTVGYQVTSGDGRTFFYTSDTGPGLSEVWRQVSPELLIIEVTAPNRHEDFARRSGHLAPGLLRQELLDFRGLRGYLPQVVLVHMNPLDEEAIGAEIADVAGELNASIRLGGEGMRLHLPAGEERAD